MTDETCGYPGTHGPCKNPVTDGDSCWIESHGGTVSGHGRESKLNLERQENICQAIENGKSVNSAARMAGVHPATVYAWIDKGEDQDEGIYADFRDRFLRARGYGEDYYVKTIIEIAEADGDLATLMSMLKQRYPESYGQVDRGEQAGNEIVVYDKAPDKEDLERLLRPDDGE